MTTPVTSIKSIYHHSIENVDSTGSIKTDNSENIDGSPKLAVEVLSRIVLVPSSGGGRPPPPPDIFLTTVWWRAKGCRAPDDKFPPVRFLSIYLFYHAHRHHFRGTSSTPPQPSPVVRLTSSIFEDSSQEQPPPPPPPPEDPGSVLTGGGRAL